MTEILIKEVNTDLKFTQKCVYLNQLFYANFPLIARGLQFLLGKAGNEIKRPLNIITSVTLSF